MRHPSLTLIAILVAGPIQAQQDAPPTVIERLIIDANPCASASTELMGMQIGVDQLRAVSVEGVSLAIEGDIMTSRLTGSLACESAQNSLSTGFVSAGIDAEVVIDLSTCTPGEITVAISDPAVKIDLLEGMGGMGAFFEQQLPQLLEPALRDSLSERAVEACEKLKTDG
ncbi:hypothetical protein LCGC14_2329700 [marine sediment metagenome]|uniref:Uncharacterized protein n=1 Tax=marine sediment metagenome TaxID=412755 RepID=A0A0F9FAA1_9ZZZZ